MQRAIEYLFENEKFSVRYHSPDRDFDDLRTEFNRDALRISQAHGQVYIAFSSGVDSQVIARCFQDQKLDAEYVFVHVVGCNDKELEHVLECEKFFGINVRKFELRLDEKRDEWIEKARRENHVSMHQYQFAWLSEQLPESWPLVSQGMIEPAIVGAHTANVSIYHNLYEAMECRFRLMEKHRPIVDFPFSPEAVASYYTDETLQTFCRTFKYFYDSNLCAPTDHFNTFAKPLVKGKHFGDSIIWYGKMTGFENHPDWIVSDIKRDTKVSVPYWDAVNFLQTSRGQIKDYANWIYKYDSSPARP